MLPSSPSKVTDTEFNFLTSAINSYSSRTNAEVNSDGTIIGSTRGTQHDNALALSSLAMAAEFHEELITGAVSKAGALPYGDEVGWLKLAEDKLKRENAIDHQVRLQA
jgi:hypothetical protein